MVPPEYTTQSEFVPPTKGSLQLIVRVPKWANWLAQDKTGGWHFYENRPKKGSFNSNFWTRNGTGLSLHCAEGVPNPEWATSLRRIDKDGKIMADIPEDILINVISDSEEYPETKKEDPLPARARVYTPVQGGDYDQEWMGGV